MHQLLRGLTLELPVGSSPGETCLAPGTSAATARDTASPAEGQAFWYLVRARNSCGTGTYGTTSAGDPRSSAGCP